MNAVHVPTDTPTGRPVQHKYGQRHDHDKHAHVGWCVRVQTARSCHTRCHPGGQDGDGRRGKDWWDLPDLSRHTHARTVLRVQPRLHKISVSSVKGPMSGRQTCSYRIHIASLPPRNGSLPILVPHDFRRRGREGGAITGLGPPHRRTHARLHSPVTWSTARTRSPSPRRHVPMQQAQVERRTGDGRRRWRQSTAGGTAGRARWGALDHRHAHHLPLNHVCR